MFKVTDSNNLENTLQSQQPSDKCRCSNLGAGGCWRWRSDCQSSLVHKPSALLSTVHGMVDVQHGALSGRKQSYLDIEKEELGDCVEMIECPFERVMLSVAFL